MWYPTITHDQKDPFDKKESMHHVHGLRTPNEGINQRNLKFWADLADKICFGRT